MGGHHCWTSSVLTSCPPFSSVMLTSISKLTSSSPFMVVSEREGLRLSSAFESPVARHRYLPMTDSPLMCISHLGYIIPKTVIFFFDLRD